MMMDNMDGSWAIAGMIMMIAFWIGLVALVIWAIESFRPRPVQTHESPLEIAARRYAAGEISREEFEQIGRDLRMPRGNPV